MPEMGATTWILVVVVITVALVGSFFYLLRKK